MDGTYHAKERVKVIFIIDVHHFVAWRETQSCIDIFVDEIGINAVFLRQSFPCVAMIPVEVCADGDGGKGIAPRNDFSGRRKIELVGFVKVLIGIILYLFLFLNYFLAILLDNFHCSPRRSVIARQSTKIGNTFFIWKHIADFQYLVLIGKTSYLESIGNACVVHFEFQNDTHFGFKFQGVIFPRQLIDGFL